MLERWGSFSVIDHKAAEALVTDVLAYDRLVFPVPPDQAERARWAANAWDPDLQDKRLEELGDRAIRVPWDQRRRDGFAKNWQRARAVALDSQILLPNSAYQMTREILALDPQRALPRGVTKATVVPAYHSADDLKKEYRISKAKRDDEVLSLLIRNRIAQPAFSDSPEQNLQLAIQLSRDAGFQEKRRSLYAWQEDMLTRKVEPGRAMENLEELIEKYNSGVTAAERKVTYRFVFTVATVGLTMAGALLATPVLAIPFGLATASSALALVRFAAMDSAPVFQAGEAAPAAMFHDIDATFKL